MGKQPLIPGRVIHLERLEQTTGDNEWVAAPCHAATVAAATPDNGILVVELNPRTGKSEWSWLRKPGDGGWHWPTECEYEWPEW